MTADDDDFFSDAKPRQKFVPAFCPLKNIHAIIPSMDLTCVNCGAEFPWDSKEKEHERVPRNCRYEVDLR